MAQRGIREYDAKKMLFSYLKIQTQLILVDEKTDYANIEKENKWLKSTRLVVKPDQLFGKRGKHKLLLLDADLNEVKKFIREKMGKMVVVGKTEGTLSTFLIEPFIKHDKEYYVSIRTLREEDIVLFSSQGGIEIEENMEKVVQIRAPTGENLDENRVSRELKNQKINDKIVEFITSLYKFFVEYNFSFIEINPFTLADGKILPLDIVAKVDDTAGFQMREKWGNLTFPPPFGRELSPEEEMIKKLDENSGASLKLTLLHPDGIIWTMVAGGGASVIYADTISDLGYGKELANYGEYSGNPSTEETYIYAKTMLDLMTRKKDPNRRPKILLIGGGIANFTEVGKTFTGIVKAIREFRDRLKKVDVKIYVRRGGPGYREGLEMMKQLGIETGLPMHIYGPEVHMTKIVTMAIKEIEVSK